VDFDLTPEMIDKIAFAMEDQDERFAIDVATGELAPIAETEGPAAERFVPLPRWGPAEGFHLMQSFVSTLHNPVYRDLLSQSLTAGKGVFRQFKDTLKRTVVSGSGSLQDHACARSSWPGTTREAHGLEAGARARRPRAGGQRLLAS
jgi:hypothetical protein